MCCKTMSGKHHYLLAHGHRRASTRYQLFVRVSTNGLVLMIGPRMMNVAVSSLERQHLLHAELAGSGNDPRHILINATQTK